MKSFGLVCVVAILAVVSAAPISRNQGRIGSKITFSEGELVLSPRPHEYLTAADLPAAFTWGNVNGVNYLTERRNQHGIEAYCGSCWDFASTSAVSDRIAILRNNTWPAVVLSAQVVLNCGYGGSCGGGNPGGVFEGLHKHGLPDETCQAYVGKSNDNCDPQYVCATCSSSGVCTAVSNYTSYYVSEYGNVSGADKMKAEIFARGPIVCGIDATNKLEAYTGGVFSEYDPLPLVNHDISVVGWGVTNDTTPIEYWIVRNSWGSFWGERGFFRIQMHKNNLAIESDCAWAVPTLTKPSSSRTAAKKPVVEKKPEAVSASAAPVLFDRTKPQILLAPGPRPSLITSPLPIETIDVSAVDAFDWRNVNGTNYLPPLRNQHLPQYCGSCWAHATTSALSARFAIANNDSYTVYNLSPQILINCVNGSNCGGGDPLQAYAYIASNGIMDDTGTWYEAKNLPCTDYYLCHTCEPSGKCVAVQNCTQFFASQFGEVSGEEAMKAEIYARGPIACTIAVTSEFVAYNGGVFQDKTGALGQDHSVMISGWGVDSNGVKYWNLVNSWGGYWGETGSARLIRGINNLGIETQGCQWAVPRV